MHTLNVICKVIKPNKNVFFFGKNNRYWFKIRYYTYGTAIKIINQTWTSFEGHSNWYLKVMNTHTYWKYIEK